MADLNGFNANEFPDDAFTVEEGEYLAMMTESKLTPTKKDPSVHYLYIKFEILEGKFKGRKVEDRLNIRHADEQVRQISNQKLAAICKAVGTITPKSSEELHDKPLALSVKLEKSTWNGEERMQNRIARYYSRDALSQKRAEGAATPAGTKPAWAQG
jgi:hypothetical protein